MQVMDSKKSRTWVVLGTGGTIAGTAASATDHTGYSAGQLGVQQLLDAVPALSDTLQGDALVCEQVAQLDSKDMDHATWQSLARRCLHWMSQPEVAGLVITHGTDTLEETAWFLQQVLGPRLPVVLTCAMRPATACAGRIHSARDVQKVHPYRLDAFGSGESGPLGWVEQGQARWARPGISAPGHAHRALARPVADWPWVAVLHSHAGTDARQVQALVVAGTGNGTVHQALLAALLAAQARGCEVRLTTRCAEGHIVGQPAALQTAAPGLNPYKARIDLMLHLLD